MPLAKIAAALWIVGAIALVIAGVLMPHVQLPFFAAAALFSAVAIITIRTGQRR